MKLMTAELKKILPPLYTNEKKSAEETIVQCKFFDPTGRWTMYVTEYDGKDTFYGYVISMFGPGDDEWGYASLSELQSIRGRMGLGIERDLYFKPKSIADLAKTIPGLAKAAYLCE